MEISCAFATSLETPDHIVHAEQLGYRRAWCYDSPALYPDVWVALNLAAQRTTTIGLGPGVLVPSLRHPMVNAAAIAELAARAPDRVVVAIGAGFTGRMTMGQRPLPWSFVAEYVRVLRALVRGEDAIWDGGVVRMLHPEGFVAARPVTEVPILIAADGPKGRAVAAELGDGVFSAGVPSATGSELPKWRALLSFGTVMGEHEQFGDERVLAAAGHGLAVGYHALYERGGAPAVDALPGGSAWRAAIEAFPTERRHLAIHEDHLVAVTDRDMPAVREGAALLGAFTLTGTATAIRERVVSLAASGVTEIAYQPAGPDIPGELERFMTAVQP